MDNWIEEEITLAELSERFVGNNDFISPEIYDISSYGIEVLTESENGEIIYKPIKSFVVKPEVDEHYTDGNIKVTSEHRFIVRDSNGKFQTIFAKDCDGFEIVNESMKVVDIEVDGEHSYLANNHLNHNTTSGGKALQFHASCRLRLKAVGQLKSKIGSREEVIGIKTKAQVVKNRMGPPLRTAEFNILFQSGVDDISSWIDVMKDYNIIKQAGAWYTYVNEETGEEIKFQSKDFEEKILNVDNYKTTIYDKMCEKLIMSYKDNELKSDDITVGTADGVDI